MSVNFVSAAFGCLCGIVGSLAGATLADSDRPVYVEDINRAELSCASFGGLNSVSSYGHGKFPATLHLTCKDGTILKVSNGQQQKTG